MCDTLQMCDTVKAVDRTFRTNGLRTFHEVRPCCPTNCLLSVKFCCL